MFGGSICVGIDIGRHSVKVAVLEVERQHVKLLKQSDVLPPPWTERLDGDDDLIERLRAVAPLLPHGQRTVSAAIEGEGAWCQYLELPPVATDEMTIAVRSAARKHVPFPLDNATLSFVPLAASSSTTVPGRRPILAVAARREQVDRYSRCMTAAGLRLDRLDINPLAVARAFTANHPQVPGVQVVLDLGARWTHCVLMQDGCPRSIRWFSPAVGDFVRALAVGTRTSWAEAEQRLRKHDFLTRNPFLEQVIDRWADEVARTLAAFGQRAIVTSGTLPRPNGNGNGNAAGPKSPIQAVTLTGGGALLPGIDMRLRNRLDIPVDVERWSAIHCKGPEPAPLYQTAVGLALRV